MLFVFNSENNPCQFHITIDVELLEKVEYKLVYLDQDRNNRGTSSTFNTPASPSIPLPSLQSSGSFETVSDDESSFTVINRPEDVIVSESWQLAGESGDESSDQDDDDDDDQSDDDDPCKIEIQLPPSLSHSADETTISKLIDNASIVPMTASLNMTNDTIDPKLPSVEDERPIQLKPMELNLMSTGLTGINPITSPPPSYTGLTSNDDEGNDYNRIHVEPETIMSKSAVFGDAGDELLSKAEIKSLQTRNRAHVKKINKLSELLDTEKSNTSQLLDTVSRITEEHVKSQESNKILKCELNNVQRRLKRVTKDLEDKDKLIASLKTSNELLRRQLDQQMAIKRRDEQVLLPQKDKVSPSVKREEASDRKCDIGITKPSTTKPSYTSSSSKKRQHRSRDHHNYPRRRHHHQQPTRNSPRKHEPFNDYEYVKMPEDSTERKQSEQNNDEHYICPVCNRRMPATLTEKQMTIHVESCLKKREA